MGVATGCGCKEVYRFPHTINPVVASFIRPNYIHSASNDIHTDGPRATARARG